MTRELLVTARTLQSALRLRELGATGILASVDDLRADLDTWWDFLGPALIPVWPWHHADELDPQTVLATTPPDVFGRLAFPYQLGARAAAAAQRAGADVLAHGLSLDLDDPLSLDVELAIHGWEDVRDPLVLLVVNRHYPTGWRMLLGGESRWNWTPNELNQLATTRRVVITSATDDAAPPVLAKVLPDVLGLFYGTSDGGPTLACTATDDDIAAASRALGLTAPASR